MAIPKDWTAAQLGNITLVSWGNTSLTKASYVSHGATAFSASGPDGFVERAEHNGNGIVLSAIGARCGRCFWASGSWTAIKNTITITAIGKADLGFMFQFLNRPGVWPSEGGAQPFIALGPARSLLVPVPPLPEQKKIAAVLSSVDAAIEKTEAVIAQLQVVKKAMMEQLLTKGMPGRHTRFKQTDLGVIPEEWTIRRIADLGLADTQVVRSGPFGSSLKTKDFLDRGIPVLTIQSLGEGTILRDGLFFISEEKAKELQEYKLLVNDLVFSRVADIGRCAAITTEETGWLISSNLTRVRLDPARASAQLIAEMLTMSPPVRRQIQMLTGSSGRPVISSNMLQQIVIPLAPISEQLAISECCNSIQQRISQESSTVNALRSLKSSLSSSLLSGELRVPTDSVPCPV